MKKLYGLVGRKLSHSYSPEIHNALGNKDYHIFELEPNELEPFLKKGSLGGVNVTMPYKETVLTLCDELSESAQKIGAVNTIVNNNGKLYGYNTDMDAFIRMAEDENITFENKKVLILGSGGTSRTVSHAVSECRAGEVVVVSRNGKNTYENISDHSDADIIINTTPVGMFPSCPEKLIDITVFTKLCGVIDVIFNPLRTQLVIEAAEKGIKAAGGISMLVYQAAEAHKLFFPAGESYSSPQEIIFGIKKKKTNIILVGMPGSGKTTIARKLSAAIGKVFADTDEMIEMSAGIKPSEIIRVHGEKAFRKHEIEAIKEVGKNTGAVISVGGGAVTQRDNYYALKQNGIIFYVDRDVCKLASHDRPLSNSYEARTKLYEERKDLYHDFCDHVVYNNSTIDEAVGKIIEIYRSTAP